MRIKKIRVTGLFGLFDHEIPLQMEARITIVHGPNGYGKTIMLRMAAGLLTGEYAVFQQIPFDVFSLEFDDGRTLSIRRLHQAGSPPAEGHELKIELAGGGPAEPKSHVLRTRVPRDPRRGPERLDPYVAALLDPNHARQLARAKALRNVGARWLTELRAQLPSIRFIQTQRLVVSDPHEEGESRPTVEAYSQEIASRMEQTLAAYAARSQELDRTFPVRLMNQEHSEQLETEVLRRKLSDLEQKRSELTQLGFLDSEQSPGVTPTPVLEQKGDVLSVYVADVEKKLAVFDELAAKIRLLTRIINGRFLFKRLQFHRERGYVFTSATGAPLEPADLSSGEQHELILLHELLFKLEKNALVLIDEPEISLHVAWQENFLPDLIEMVKLAQVDVLLATHSSEIIGDHWDLTVALQAPPVVRRN